MQLHADTGYRKTTKIQIVMVEGNENSADVCKRKDDRPISAEIVLNKNITDNRKFRN